MALLELHVLGERGRITKEIQSIACEAVLQLPCDEVVAVLWRMVRSRRP